MNYNGPIGLGGGGSGDESGPSSRSKLKTAAVRRLEDSKPLPTSEEVRTAERNAERSGGGVYEYWLNAMREVLFERNASASVDRPRFQANVRFLIDKEGLTKARITELIDEFARRVQVGQINVDGKPAWGVFMGTWRKLGGSASADGLAKKQKTWTRDDIR